MATSTESVVLNFERFSSENFITILKTTNRIQQEINKYVKEDMGLQKTNRDGVMYMLKSLCQMNDLFPFMVDFIMKKHPVDKNNPQEVRTNIKPQLNGEPIDDQEYLPEEIQDVLKERNKAKKLAKRTKDPKAYAESTRLMLEAREAINTYHEAKKNQSRQLTSMDILNLLQQRDSLMQTLVTDILSNVSKQELSRCKTGLDIPVEYTWIARKLQGARKPEVQGNSVDILDLIDQLNLLRSTETIHDTWGVMDRLLSQGKEAFDKLLIPYGKEFANATVNQSNSFEPTPQDSAQVDAEYLQRSITVESLGIEINLPKEVCLLLQRRNKAKKLAKRTQDPVHLNQSTRLMLEARAILDAFNKLVNDCLPDQLGI